MRRSRLRFLLVFVISFTLLLSVSLTKLIPLHAAGGTSSRLTVSVGYAEDKHQSSLNPGAFPVPWSGSPNTIFLGNPVFGSGPCGNLPHCYDAGAIRLDNNGSSNIAVDKVSVDDHSSIPGGKVFNLWGSFTVPAGKSVILTQNPPGNNPSYDNFDTSGAPNGNCTPLSVAPKVTITIGGVPTTLVDSTHVLDTNGIDTESCQVQQNEAIQWRKIGATGVKTATLTLGPSTTTLAVGQKVTETATLVDGGGSGLANANVSFAVTRGPDAGHSGSAVTDHAGQASFTYSNTTPGTDIVVASVATASTVGPLQSNQASVFWSNGGPSPTPTVSPSPGTTLAQDTFQRANQQHWGTASDGLTWGGDANNSSVFSLVNNTGQLSKGGSIYNAVLGPVATDSEVVFSGSLSSFKNTNLGAVLHWKDTNNWYKAYIDGTNLVVQKKVNGTTTTLKTVPFAATAGTSYSIDFSIVGTTLSANVWRTGTTEPSGWMVTATDRSLSSGLCGLRIQMQSGVTATITSFQALS